MSVHPFEYKREQEYIIYNYDDPDMGGVNAIRVDLPSVESFYDMPWDEAIKLIDGYGLPPEQQKFDTYRDSGYYSLPPKLKNIEVTIRKKRKIKDKEKLFPEDFFDEIESDSYYYREEIEYIKKTRNRSISGYWCFIKGRPTYIDGWHYTYVAFTPIENDNRRDKLPDYRDVDRRIFLFFKWAYTTTEATFKYSLTYNKNGNVKKKYFNNKNTISQFVRFENIQDYYIEDEGYRVDMKYRTVFGVVLPKRRRFGGTFMGAHIGMRIAVDNGMGTFAIQALTEDTAIEDVYQKKVLAPWRRYPFFFKPCASVADTNALVFTKKDHVSFANDVTEHGGWIRPRSSANKAFDGNKLWAYINDESGKKTSGNVLHEFTDTIRNALAQGQEIHGLSIYTSTFGEFESGGGKEYFDLCIKSYSHKRDDNGITASGMVTLMMPAYDGYDGRVDQYGDSIINDPDEPYINLSGEEVDEGAKTTLMKRRAFLEEIKDWNGLNNEVRNNPFSLREAGKRGNRSNFWDISINRTRISELKFGENKVVDVNFEWTNGPWSSVRMVDGTPENPGKWKVSLRPPIQYTNRFTWDSRADSYIPDPDCIGKYILGTDPFSYNTGDVKGKKKSNGGGAMYMPFDPLIDTPDKSPSDWITGDFIMTYNNRVELTDEYCEDMLLAAVYCGSLVFTERNVDHVMNYFRKNKASAYLLHQIDPKTGRIDPIPGVRVSSGTHEKIYSKYGDYVKNVGSRARHIEVLEQIDNVQSFDDMTDNDLFAAGGMALLGAESKHTEIMKTNNSPGDLSGLVDLYD